MKNIVNDQSPLVSIVILNYNSGNLIIECIKSILKSEYQNFEIILVDNASTDKSHIKCKEKFSKIKLIKNKENLGYCGGNNVGIRNANGSFLVILNPDTVVERSWLKELIKAHKFVGEGLFQPKLLSLDDKKRINTSGNIIQLFGFGYSRGKGTLDAGQYDTLEKIPYASGACLFVSKDIINKIGLFDPFLFAYHDDLDLGWRAACQGISSYYVPNSIVYHAESFSFKWSPLKLYLLERNRWYCLLTHYSKETFYKLLPSILATEFFVFVFYLLKGNVKAKISGYCNIFQNRKLIHEKYMELESKKNVPDREIIKNFENIIEAPYQMSGPMFAKAFNHILKFLSKMSRLVI